MPAIITKQPEIHELLSAYKPIVIACTATTDSGDVPTLVVCDVYVNSAYYRSFFSSKSEASGEYVFDIQDAIQEKLEYFIPPMDGKQIEITTKTMVDVFVKLRTYKRNFNGLNEPEQVEPIPGTDEHLPITGQGVTSNKFFALNLLIQHEENQNLFELLSAYRTNDWNLEAVPLTRRNPVTYMTSDQSSFFPFLTESTPKLLHLQVRYKGEKTWSQYTTEIDWSNNVNEITNPPTINIKWYSVASGETINPHFWDLKWGAFPPIQIKTYPEDPDMDIVSVEMFRKHESGPFTSMGLVTGNVYDVTALAVGMYEFKAKVTDSKGNFAESNILQYEVRDTTPAPGSINLNNTDVISVTGGTYHTLVIDHGPINPDGSHLYTYSSTFNINLSTSLDLFYSSKGMDTSQLRIRFKPLFGYSPWKYNNTLVTNINYTTVQVQPNQVTNFSANNEDDMSGAGTFWIMHSFEIWHTSDPGTIYTNFIQMEFN